MTILYVVVDLWDVLNVSVLFIVVDLLIFDSYQRPEPSSVKLKKSDQRTPANRGQNGVAAYVNESWDQPGAS